jgi:hypothetical protein
MLRSDDTDASTRIASGPMATGSASYCTAFALNKCHHRPVDSYRSGPPSPPPMRRPFTGPRHGVPHASLAATAGWHDRVTLPDEATPFASLALPPCLAEYSA